MAEELSSLLGIDKEAVRKKVEKRSVREIIKTNVDKETGDAVRRLKLSGVKVDEDYKGITLMEAWHLRFRLYRGR